MLPILQIGPLAVQLPGLILLAGLWVCTWIIEREANGVNLRGDLIVNMVFYGLLAGIIGARLGYALRFVDIYIDDPLALFSLNPQTLSLLEGVLTAVVVALAYGQRKGLSLLPTLDPLAPGVACFGIFLGLAHLASGDAFGAPTQVPWAVHLWGAQRHPSQVYEILMATVILLAVLRVRRLAPFAGFNFFFWLSLSAGGRLFLEAFRGDSVILFQALRRAQIWSLALLLASMAALYFLGRRERSGETAP
jgi:phosphatidylglycerol:prolipoprotein diacylglycerol transferase